MQVTPWEVKGNIDYDKLIKEFGVKPISDALLKRIEKHAKAKGLELHHLLRRKLIFAHRDLKRILDDYEKGKPFFLYTGRSPSGPIHLGHMYIWEFTKWLQDVFDVELWFQFPDDEKFLFKQDLEMKEVQHWLQENMKDVAALGFDAKKTHFLIDTQHAGIMYPQAIRVAKKITYSTVKGAFGFQNDTNIGAIFYTSMQAVPTFLPSVLKGENINCLIPHAIDQDPHFRVTRDVVEKLGYPKPASIQGMFLPGLAGMETDGKMSSSKENTAIYTTDTAAQIKKKINKYAFSGGKDTLEEHREHGGNPDIDIAFQWLIFFDKDDKNIERLRREYISGELLSGEMKAELIELLQEKIARHQEERSKSASLVKKMSNINTSASK